MTVVIAGGILWLLSPLLLSTVIAVLITEVYDSILLRYFEQILVVSLFAI